MIEGSASEQNVSELKPGDTVRLKAGGPDMTIKGKARGLSISDLIESDWSCQWFDGKELLEGEFSQESLVKI